MLEILMFLLIGLIIFLVCILFTNYEEPMLKSQAATVLSKSVWHVGHHEHTYYVVFELVKSGEKIKCKVSLKEFRRLAEGDKGILRYEQNLIHSFTYVSFEK